MIRVTNKPKPISTKEGRDRVEGIQVECYIPFEQAVVGDKFILRGYSMLHKGFGKPVRWVKAERQHNFYIENFYFPAYIFKRI